VSEHEDDQRTTWVPMAIAGALVAGILVAIFTIDGTTDGTDDQPDQPAPSTPVSTLNP